MLDSSALLDLVEQTVRQQYSPLMATIARQLLLAGEQGDTGIVLDVLCTLIDYKGSADQLAQTLIQENHINCPNSPFVLIDNVIMLQRYQQAERVIAQTVANCYRNSVAWALPSSRVLTEWFDDLYQRNAAINAFRYSMSFINGGPGTGKTTTVAKILALFLQQSTTQLKIALTAPTGKAAQRLSDSVSQALYQSDIQHKLDAATFSILSHLKGQTLHRLLSNVSSRAPAGFYNKLPHDLIIIDESSMADVLLIERLCHHLKPEARLIFLGDQHQLSSVKAGQVFAALCHALPKLVTTLITSYRFLNAPLIGEAAKLILQQNSQATLELCQENQLITSFEIQTALKKMSDGYQAYFDQVQQIEQQWRIAQLTVPLPTWLETNPAVEKAIIDLFQPLNHYRMLAATRTGPAGTQTLNERFLRHLRRYPFLSQYKNFQTGSVVLVNKNQPDINIFNGDIGIVIVCRPDIWVIFQTPQGIRTLSLQRLTEYEWGFAMTIHKSQGSEFRHVDIALGDHINLLASNELLYTAITRAKTSFFIHGSPDILCHMIQTKQQRYTQLTRYIPQYIAL